MSGRVWLKLISLFSLLGGVGIAGASSSVWHYTIDEPRRGQQANFCGSEKDVEELAGIFERFGPRTGYAALSESPNCEIAVRSFTPRRIVTTVTISKGKPGEYKIRFVEVENDRGEVLFLVTTRDVVAE